MHFKKFSVFNAYFSPRFQPLVVILYQWPFDRTGKDLPQPRGAAGKASILVRGSYGVRLTVAKVEGVVLKEMLPTTSTRA